MMPNDDGLKIITAGELMETQLIPQHQIVDEFLPAGTYILFGDPKIGKSFLVTQLCWNVSEGKPFLEHETQRADVLYLALEDTDPSCGRPRKLACTRCTTLNWLLASAEENCWD